MELKKVQKKSNPSFPVSCRLNKKDINFIRENGISIRKIIEISLETLRKERVDN